MPKEIEDYVHQIGRTGRSGKTGIATTFVNSGVQEQTLLDLKYLLMEAKQRCVDPNVSGRLFADSYVAAGYPTF
jgi:ATP-dependent RNA helicase DDX41